MSDWKDEIRQRLGDLRLEPTREAEIVEELSQHLEDRYLELRSGGAAEEDARTTVLAELSGGELLQRELQRVESRVLEEPVCLGAAFETTLGGRRRNMFADLWQDFRYGSRVLLKKPGFTAIAVITLALGIGANTALFSVVNGVLLRPLPYSEPEHLVWMGGWSRGGDKEMGVTPADFLDYREQNTTFAQFAASISDTLPATLTGSGEPERLKIAAVTANYLDVFGLKPELGRTFIAEEEQAGRGSVVVLSRSLWQRRFGADPSIIDRTITLDGTSLTVIGVMPPEFQYPLGAELWKPMSFDGPPQSPMKSREFHFLRPVGLLKSGMTIEQAQAEVETIARALESQYPKTNTNLSLYLMPLQERIVGKVKLTLVVLLGAVGFVLLIACANVANLLLVRAASRQKEMAVRSALGASRGRIVRQMLAESLMLALCGGVCAVILASWGADLLVALSAGDLPRAAEIGIDRTVLGFTFAISLVTGLVFGLAPALQSSRLDLNEALKESGRSGSNSDQTNRARNLLVICECALAVVLLIGAGLLLKSFVKLQQVSPGFDEQNLLTARVDLPGAYAQLEKKAGFWSELQQRV
ncbi:MAG TPA: ABC transporter permease, partial [Blastocatellia bacterium]|nr:ABC transporter permease [Blastocatellia bacterium]